MPTGLKRATIDTEIAVYGNVPTTETSATILDRRALETGTHRVSVSNFLGLKTVRRILNPAQSAGFKCPRV